MGRNDRIQVQLGIIILSLSTGKILLSYEIFIAGYDSLFNTCSFWLLTYIMKSYNNKACTVSLIL